MPRFAYQALNAQQQPVEGVVEAASLAAAVTGLEEAGMTLRSIAQAEAPEAADDSATIAEPELVAAVERLLEARSEFLGPLTAYVRELPPSQRRRELKAILAVIAEGSSEEAVQAAARDPLSWGSLLSAAASTDDDASVLARFIDREESKKTLRRRRGTVMAYPLFIFGLTLLVGWPIAVFLLPTFREIYQSFGLELPVFTRLILDVGNFFERGGGFVLVGLVVVFFVAWTSLPYWAPAWLTRIRDFVAARGSRGAIASAQLARAASELVEAGLAPASALRTAGERIGGLAGDRAIRLASQVATAESSAAEPVVAKGALAYAFSQETPIAARTAVLRDLSQCHEERSTSRASWVNGFAGPVATVAVGLVVGAVVIALFLPLFRLVQGLS